MLRKILNAYTFWITFWVLGFGIWESEAGMCQNSGCFRMFVSKMYVNWWFEYDMKKIGNINLPILNSIQNSMFESECACLAKLVKIVAKLDFKSSLNRVIKISKWLTTIKQMTYQHLYIFKLMCLSTVYNNIMISL